jgi:hypothetical protein
MYTLGLKIKEEKSMFSQQTQWRLLIALFVTVTLWTVPAGNKNIKPLRMSEAYGEIPLSFEANQGQSDGHVKFLSRGSGYGLFLTQTEAVLELNRSQSALLRLQFVGANAATRVEGLEELSGKSNYIIGNESGNWRTNLPNYSRVRYEDLYPGVDMIFYGNQRRLEYDFIVAPGADPKEISLLFQGADKMRIDDGGDLLLQMAGSDIRQHRPVVYQTGENGSRELIAAQYVFKNNNEIGFQLGSYDSERPLVIDPVLSYSTYFGGVGEDVGFGIAIDGAGNTYVTGSTSSADLPQMNPMQRAAGGRDVFVAKLNPSGNAFIYSTFLGGSNTDQGFGIAVDSSGNAYITGQTSSTNFPTVNAFQATFNGGFNDAFVAKLNPAGNALIYSTYLGGNNFEMGFGIAVDTAGSAYVAGETGSSNLPVLNPVQTTFGGASDGFAAKLNPQGNALVYLTYLGGNVEDLGSAIAVDSGGNAYVAGATESIDFPTTPGSLKPEGDEDAIVVKLNPQGNLVYSTYLGGEDGEEGATGIAVDSEGNVYVTGFTESEDYPVVNALQEEPGGERDVFVTKLNRDGSGLIYSTYLGGSESDQSLALALGADGNVYVTGITASEDFPLMDPIQDDFGGGVFDGFLARIDSSGGTLIYSSYFGGSSQDAGLGLAVDPNGNLYLIGSTLSPDLPTEDPIQPAHNGMLDAFIAKIVESDFALNITPGTQMVVPGASVSFTIDVDALGNFAQAVNLSANLVPSDGSITTRLSANSITPGGSATLTVNTTAATKPGAVTITIRGMAGQIARTRTAILNVAATPDFALNFNPSTINVSRGQSGQITVGIGRTGGFAGNVTVTAPDTKAIKIKLTPPSQSTTGASVSFNFKVKRKAATGPQQITFVGRDDSRRTRMGTVNLIIQ